MSRSVTPFVLLLGLLSGCSDGPSGLSGPAQPVFTSLSLSASSQALFTRPPGNTATLTVNPLDQDGRPMAVQGTPTYASDDSGVVSVDASGRVSAVASGSTTIRAALTAGGATHTGTVPMIVTDGDRAVTVTAPGTVFEPRSVDIVQGGTVTWTFGSIQHNVVFRTEGAPEDLATTWVNGSRSRTFPARGTFQYQCTFHQGMSGEVVVH
jgi:plastocyanin